MTLNLALANVTPTGLGSPPTRTLGGRYHEIVNVKDYGATGDGVTDDWAAIMAAYNHEQVKLTVTGTNQTASFTGQQCYATFNGTCSGNTLTINSGLVGTVVAGQTLVTSGGNRVINNFISGTSWAFLGATLAVGPENMSTNAVLVVSGMVAGGTISTNNVVIGTGVYSYASFVGSISGTTLTINSGFTGTIIPGQVLWGAGICNNPPTTISNNLSGSGNGSTWALFNAQEYHDIDHVPIQAWFVQNILGQQSGFGTPGGNGVYVMLNPINVGPVPMITVGTTITFASVPSGILQYYMEDLTTSSAFNPVASPNINSITSTQITCNAGEVYGLVNINDIITVNVPAKGIIYFPRGTYVVSQPIDFSNINTVNAVFKGSLGETSVIGNFPDYVFRRGLYTTSARSGLFAVEGLSITNNHANGGGIRIGLSAKGAYVSNCTVTANRGINTASDDIIAGTGSQEVAINNCYLSPGVGNAAGSVGIMSVSDGPIANCHLVGFDRGIITWGQQGDMIIMGGTIELCKSGIQPGTQPNGNPGAGFGMRISGVCFKNCGTAIDCSGGSTGGCTFDGIVIDAAEGTIAGNPQYGMRLDNVGGSFFNGIRVNGQYAQYGIQILDQGTDNWMYGVQAFNTSSLVRPAWLPPTGGGSCHFVNCNVPTTAFPLATLPAITVGIAAISWASGTTTLKVFQNVSGFGNMTVTVSGVSPAGYNGTFINPTIVGGFIDTLSYPQTGPLGTATVLGSAIINKTGSAVEGDCYNVNNSDVSTWGGSPSATAGSVHAKVRWNGSNWIVIGV